MAITKPILLDETGKRMAGALENLALGSENANPALLMDGTAATYKSVMRNWFIANGALEATAAQLTALVDKWYTITRTGWDGGVQFYQPSVSDRSDGTKTGDNAGLVCVASTDTVAGRDDYAGLPLFACVDCNWTVDASTLEPVITAIDGITPGFKRYDTSVFVGVLQMAGFYYRIETTTSYTDGYTDGVSGTQDRIPVPESVRVDGTVRPWVVHSKYLSSLVNNKLTACAGVTPKAHVISHNSLHTYAGNIGAQYSGMSVLDDAWLKLMGIIKYGRQDSDTTIAGCSNHSDTSWAQASEASVNRVLLASGDGAKYPVGSTIMIGTATATSIPGRGEAGGYALSGIDGRMVTDVRSVTVSNTTYDAVYFDGAAITTTGTPSTVGGTTVQTWHWRTGSCDKVLGNDGSPVSCTSGKYPAKLQGIEYMMGAYEVYADVILKWTIEDGKNVCEPYTVNRTANQSTGITSNYRASGMRCAVPNGSNGWKYIRKLFHNGFFFPDDVNGGSSTGTRDAFWAYADGTTTGERQWQAFCGLNDGVATAGRSALSGYYGLSTANWVIASRLSPNGNRGEWQA